MAGKTKRVRAWKLGLMGVAGGALGYLLGTFLATGNDGQAFSGWHIAALPFTLWLVIAWHEAGHVVGGVLSGFRLVLYTAGPLKILREHGKLRVLFNRNLSMWGGMAAAAPIKGPTPDAESIRRALMRIVAGGPAFSLAGGALLIPAYLLLEPQPDAAAVLGVAGAFSLMIGITTLIPLQTGGFQSDGARLQQLSRGGAAAERWAALCILSGLAHTLRPRDWPRELILQCSKAGERDNDAVSAAWLRCCHHEDSGELAEARVWMEEALAIKDEWPKAAHRILHATAAVLLAQLGEPGPARQHLNQAKGEGFLAKDQLLRTEAAVLLAEGRKSEAREAASRALAKIPKDSDGVWKAAREDLERILRMSG